MDYFESWLKDKAKRDSQTTYTPPAPRKGDSKKDINRSTGYKWQTQLLKPMSTNKYGRKYEDKFNSAMREIGVTDKNEVTNFKRWMNSQENTTYKHRAQANNQRNKLNQTAQGIFADMNKTVESKAKQIKLDELSPVKKPKSKPTRVEQKNGFEKVVDTLNAPLKAFDKSVYQPIEKKAHRFAASFVDGLALDQFKKNMKNGGKALGLEAPKFVRDAVSKPKSKTDKVIDTIGEFAGMAAPISTSYKVTSPLIKPLANVLPKAGKLGVASKIGQTALRGGLGMGAYGTAREGLDEALHPKDANFSERAKSVRNDVLAGAILDPAFSVGGSALVKGIKKMTNKNAIKPLEELMPKPQEPVVNPETVVKEEKPLLLSLKNMDKQVEPPLKMAQTEIKPMVTKPIKQPVLLKSVQTTKDIEQMSKEELQSVYQRLDNEIKTLSKGKQKTPRYQDVQADLETIKNQLLKLDLQNFSEVGKIPSELLPDTKGHIGTKTEKTNIGVKEAVNTGYIKTVDNLHRLNQFDKHVEEVLGRKLNAAEQTHTLGLNSRGSDMISKQILTEKMVDKNGESIGNSLKDITMKVPKGKLKDFEDYLINRHAITRMERGEKVFPDQMNMTPDTSRAIVRNYEESHPEFKDIAKEYYEYNKQLGQKWLVDTGILSKEQWEGYLKANPDYVPNNRIFSDLERPKFTGNAKKGFANQTNPIKKATGSQHKIVSPIESTIEHTAQYVKVAKRNEVMQTLINNIKQNPEAFKDIVEIVPTETGAGTVLDSISNKLQNEGIDAVLEEFNKAFEQKPDLTKGNIVRGMINGKPVHVKVHDPALLDALTNLQPKAQNVVINAMGQVTRMMKNLTTGINPVFSLTRNIWRDIPTAFANSKSTNNPFVFSKDLVSSVISVIKNDDWYKSFKAVGGGHSSPISSDINLLAQSKRSILPREKGVWNGTKHVGGKLLGALENLNNAVEAAPRLGEFKRLAGNDYASKMKALYEANDVTVNFNKYGNIAKDIDSIIPYFNAAVQGLDKTWRVFMNGTKAERAAAAAKAFSAITIPSIVLYALNHDNPDYQKLSNYIKDSNLLIPKGDGTFYKIPKPRELGVLFGSDVERSLRAWADKDPKAFKDFGTYMIEMFAPPTRSIAAPFSDLRSNKNFMDAPIVPGDLYNNVSPQYEYDSKTSELSKKVGAIFNFSPMKSDYLIKSYGGVLGELGIPLLNKNGSVGQTLQQKVTADPVFSNDIQREFYDTKTKLDQAHNNLTKQGVKTKDLNEDLRKIFGKKSREMGDVRKEMKKVQNDSNLSADERLKKLRKLQEEINKIAESGNKLVR